jgi:hypothetical protein
VASIALRAAFSLPGSTLALIWSTPGSWQALASPPTVLASFVLTSAL